MNAYSEIASYTDSRPKTIKYCKTCEKETPHQIRGSEGVVANICVPCLSRALTYELDRD
jgi:hypothetical protein